MIHAALSVPSASDMLNVRTLCCWQAARDAGRSRQTDLSRLLAEGSSAILSPVLDSLLYIYEAALGRRIEQGVSSMPGRDIRGLIALLDGNRASEAELDCTDGMRALLGCAVRSARIMLGLVRQSEMAATPGA